MWLLILGTLFFFLFFFKTMKGSSLTLLAPCGFCFSKTFQCGVHDEQKNSSPSLIAARMVGPQVCVMFDRLIPGLFTRYNDVCAVGLLRAFQRPPHPHREDILQRMADNSVFVGWNNTFPDRIYRVLKGEKPSHATEACVASERPFRHWLSKVIC